MGDILREALLDAGLDFFGDPEPPSAGTSTQLPSPVDSTITPTPPPTKPNTPSPREESPPVPKESSVPPPRRPSAERESPSAQQNRPPIHQNIPPVTIPDAPPRLAPQVTSFPRKVLVSTSNYRNNAFVGPNNIRRIITQQKNVVRVANGTQKSRVIYQRPIPRYPNQPLQKFKLVPNTNNTVQYIHTTKGCVKISQPSRVMPPVTSILTRKVLQSTSNNSAQMVMRPMLSMVTQRLPDKHTPSTPPVYATRPYVDRPRLTMPKPQLRAPLEQQNQHLGHEDFFEDEEKMVQVDTFIEYTPLKLRSGMKHPDPVVETASMSSVSAPEIRYHMTIPEELIDSGKISALQLEAALYACQAHEAKLPSNERIGYLIGDGAGVGKGRTIATIIYENYLLGRKRAIWLSVSSDLYYDAVRDLRDIGADSIEVHPLNQMKYAKLNSAENGFVKRGVIFATYSSLIGEARHKEGDEGKASTSNRLNSRMAQLVQWCGEDFDGLIIFDECHHAKNLVPSAGSKPTKTGRYVLDLQKYLPNSRVVYASATGATEPRNMAYMTRLGLWGPSQTFPTFTEFIRAVEDRGVGAMEMVAMDMKLRGLYLARQLSFKGVDFSVDEVLLSPDFIKIYDESVKLWMECRRQFQYAIDHTRNDENGARNTWAHFWSAHQRFFKYLCIGAKVQACVQIALKALDDGKCVVIGLQSTGEAQTLGVLEDAGEITDFVSSTKAVLQSLIEKHFPTGDSDGMDVLGDITRMFSVGTGESGYHSRKRRQTKMEGPLTKRRNRNNSVASLNADEASTSGSDLSDHESDYGSDSDSEDSDGEEKLKKKAAAPKQPTPPMANDLYDTLMGELDDSFVGEIDPFHHDFSSAEDPWADFQSYSIMAKSEPEEPDSKAAAIVAEKEERRQKRRHQKRRERRRKRRELAEIRQREAAERRKTQTDTTASEFMKSTKVIDNGGAGDCTSLMMIKTELLAEVERLGRMLPPNTLDQLIDELGGPTQVAEMTGRRGRIVIGPEGQAEYQLRNADSTAPVELMNMEEKDKFMSGEKLIAVISEAASSGISLQSDRRALNTRRRVHITLELPWSADKAVQQFGRTHRSNQVSAPEYLFLISELAGEKRFASVVAKRLESLGALTHGDRRATESRDLSQFNLDNKYGREALQQMVKTLANPLTQPILPPPDDYSVGKDNFFTDMREYLVGVGVLSTKTLTSSNPAIPPKVIYNIEKEGVSLTKFLNRLLGLPVHAQNALFSYFTDIINELIKRAKGNGTFDKGIVDLGSGSDKAKRMEQRVFRGFVDNPNFVVEMHKIGAERGLKWSDAFELFGAQTDEACGFYRSKPQPGRKTLVVLVVSNSKRNTSHRYLRIVRPNTGISHKAESVDEINRRFTRIPSEEAKKDWEDQHEAFSQMCLHKYMKGTCKAEESREFCEVGRRHRTYFVLTGSVIAVWPMLEKTLAEARGAAKAANRSSIMQIVRIRTDDDQKLVGLLVLPQYVRPLIAGLHRMCGQMSSPMSTSP